MTFFLVVASLALLAIAAASIYSIVLMRDAKHVLNQLESSVKEISEKSVPVLENAGAITGKIREIAESVDGEVTNIKGVLDSLVGAIGDIVNLEQKVKSKIEEPVLEAAGFVAGVAKGIKTFLRVLKS
jgi:uncharacterized protein YoxC